jgi:hypothetical protein
MMFSFIARVAFVGHCNTTQFFTFACQSSGGIHRIPVMFTIDHQVQHLS